MIIANMDMPLWKHWLPRVAAFAVGLLLAGSVVFWFMRWPSRDTGPALPAAQATDDLPAASAAVLTRLLGAQAAPTALAANAESSNRFLLTGIVGLGGGQGLALLSIDGKPAKSYRVGSQLDEGWVLQSVGVRSVALGEQATGPLRLQLDLPSSDK